MAAIEIMQSPSKRFYFAVHFGETIVCGKRPYASQKAALEAGVEWLAQVKEGDPREVLRWE